MREIKITKNEANQRLDKLLFKYLNLAPHSFIYKMLRKKNIVLNQKKAEASDVLHIGDCIQLFLAEETIEKFREKKTYVSRHALDICYEDEHILIINKPVGMLSQKAKPEDVSANEEIIAYLLNSHKLTSVDLETFTPGICNRLDRNTSGLLSAGKTLEGLKLLSKLWKERTIHKYYLTVVKGTVTKPLRIRGFLKKDARTNRVTITTKKTEDSQEIETLYRPLVSNNHLTLLEVLLVTGKTHQIRAHLASVSHPVLGDYKYGDRAWNDSICHKYSLKHQLLHAYRLEFPKLSDDFLALSNQIITAEPPKILQRILQEELGVKENAYLE